jgi:hypothetical protein
MKSGTITRVIFDLVPPYLHLRHHYASIEYILKGNCLITPVARHKSDFTWKFRIYTHFLSYDREKCVV